MSELRVVLLGKTGSGKSSLGNTLLNREAFLVARGLCSGTDKCQWAYADNFGVILQVTDTPGLCDTHRDDKDVLQEVGKSVAVASPGPHIILMVLRCDRRFTKEEYLAYMTLKNLFWPEIMNHMILVFVGVDALGATIEQQQKTLKEQLANSPPRLEKVLRDASRRYMGINNMATARERDLQARKLLRMMQELVSANRGQYYTGHLCNDITKLVEPLVQEKMRGKAPRAEAVRSTNQDIVDEKVSPGFLSKLKGAVLPMLKEAASITGDAAAPEVAEMCSPM